jgi:hypothetical protein
VNKLPIMADLDAYSRGHEQVGGERAQLRERRHCAGG